MQTAFECWAGFPGSMQLVSWSVWQKVFCRCAVYLSASPLAMGLAGLWLKPSCGPVCCLGPTLRAFFCFICFVVFGSCCCCYCSCCCAHLHLTFGLTVYSSRSFSALTPFIYILATTTTAAPSVRIIKHAIVWRVNHS